jgi:hypothetical protein
VPCRRPGVPAATLGIAEPPGCRPGRPGPDSRHGPHARHHLADDMPVLARSSLAGLAAIAALANDDSYSVRLLRPARRSHEALKSTPNRHW